MDQGQTWTAISEDLSRSNNRGDVPYGTLTTLSESSLKFGLIWAGTDDGQVWVTNNGGDRWQDVADKLPKDRWVSRVEASAHDLNRAYVTLNGYRDDDIRAYVYRTDDLGKRFKDISKGLPAEAVNVIREDPLMENILYVGTDRGVYVSTDRGESWSALQGDLPNVPVHDLVVHPRERELVAGTHGRSIWIVDLLPLQELVEAGDDTALKVFYAADVQASRGWRGKRSRWFFRPEYAPKSTLTYWSDTAAPASIEIVDSNDAVVRRMDSDALLGMNSFEWDLLVDEERALAAETSAGEQSKESSDEADEADTKTEEIKQADAEDRDTKDGEMTNLSDTPYSESVRLGHILYATPGKYSIRVTVGENSDSVSLKIKPPKDYEPRTSEPYKLRGKK
jgi:hypothetical protein